MAKATTEYNKLKQNLADSELKVEVLTKFTEDALRRREELLSSYFAAYGTKHKEAAEAEAGLRPTPAKKARNSSARPCSSMFDEPEYDAMDDREEEEEEPDTGTGEEQRGSRTPGRSRSPAPAARHREGFTGISG